MKLGRRGFLGFLATSPIAAKAAAEQAVGSMAGMTVTGIGGSMGPPIHAHAADSIISARRLALGVPGVRAEIESLLYEEQRQVWRIDPDIAVMRSFSLAAKIAFQRQRNVQQVLEHSWLENSPYQRVWNAFNRFTGS